ncbi:hypothetical protein EKO04_000541 [Ascochyta lentis]|uniref:Uncharacterized protein n=1 Tax=Ascochyta lentis TaxID=205686 RepID=A0A8H7MI44_9PLEO|nr:hypothetical protein EKO04_000541 [Ascochyta lentis]
MDLSVPVPVPVRMRVAAPGLANARHLTGEAHAEPDQVPYAVCRMYRGCCAALRCAALRTCDDMARRLQRRAFQRAPACRQASALVACSSSLVSPLRPGNLEGTEPNPGSQQPGALTALQPRPTCIPSNRPLANNDAPGICSLNFIDASTPSWNAPLLLFPIRVLATAILVPPSALSTLPDCHPSAPRSSPLAPRPSPLAPRPSPTIARFP